MPNWYSNTFGTDNTSGGWQIVPDDTVDREVSLSIVSGSSNIIRIAFDTAQVASGAILNNLVSAENPVFRFILPSGEELWSKTDSGSATLNFVISEVG